MSTQKAKFELFARLQGLGFTYEEAAQLRRIEMTLQRWGERECGDGSDWAIERDEATGKPFNTYHGQTFGDRVKRYPIADREAGALRRLAAIVKARNDRMISDDCIVFYHQTDPRGCALYLVKSKDLEGNEIVNEANRQGCKIHPIESPEYIAWNREPTSGRGNAPARWVYTADETQWGRFGSPEAAAIRWAKFNGKNLPKSRNLPIDSYYTRGLAVCC